MRTGFVSHECDEKYPGRLKKLEFKKHNQQKNDYIRLRSFLEMDFKRKGK